MRIKNDLMITKSIAPGSFGASYTFKSDSGVVKALSLEGFPVEPFLVPLSLYDSKMSVCPHMVHHCVTLKTNEGFSLPQELHGVKVGCVQCAEIRDMCKLEVASYSCGAFRLVIYKFPEDLYMCTLVSSLGRKCKPTFQGMGYEVVSHWLRIAHDSRWKVDKALDTGCFDDMKLQYVSEKI